MAQRRSSGRRITLGLPRPDNPWITIVGIAKNVPHRAVDSQPEPDWYTSESFHRNVIVICCAQRVAGVDDSCCDSQGSSDDRSTSAVDEREDDDEVIGATTAPRRFNTWLLGVFAIVALVLAALGIYSVISYSITLRTQEIGIRMALGAQRPAILMMVLAGACCSRLLELRSVCRRFCADALDVEHVVWSHSF